MVDISVGDDRDWNSITKIFYIKQKQQFIALAKQIRKVMKRVKRMCVYKYVLIRTYRWGKALPKMLKDLYWKRISCWFVRVISLRHLYTLMYEKRRREA